MILLMMIGVMSFSFATGALSSILANLDSMDALMKSKVSALDKIREEYDINPLLYEDLMQTIVFESEIDKSNMMDFVESLPKRLKIELTFIIHQSSIMKI